MGSANFQHRLQLLFCALFSLGLGLGFIFSEFAVFAYLVMLLPWLLSISGILLVISAVWRKRKHRSIKIASAAVLIAAGIVLFRWAYLRDPMLWYFFVLYLVVSAYINMRPAWHPGWKNTPLPGMSAELPCGDLPHCCFLCPARDCRMR